MALKVGVFCPTLNICGGGEYVAVAIANSLAQNDHKVILFTNNEVNPKVIKNFFGETLHHSIQTIKQPTYFSSRGLADFYQTIFHSYIAKSKCDTFVDCFTNCIFPWTSISYIHFPYLNQYSFSKRFPYLGSPHHLPVGTIPHVLYEKNLAKVAGWFLTENDVLAKPKGFDLLIWYISCPSTTATFTLSISKSIFA